MPANTNDYILGTSDEEIRRLEFQHEVWKDAVIPLWDEAGFSNGQEILDLCCGPGFASRDLADIVGGQGTIHAVDRSAKYIQFLEAELKASTLYNIHTCVCDVHELPFKDACVDGVFARWALCFVEEPERVIAEAVRILRPGGRLVIMDYFNYKAVNIFPNRDSFTKLFQTYYQSLLDNGGTYDIAQFLPPMICEHPMELISLRPISRIAPAGSEIWKWLLLFTESYLPKLIEAGYITLSDQKALRKDFEQVAKQAGTFFCPPPIMGIIAQKIKT